MLASCSEHLQSGLNRLPCRDIQAESPQFVPAKRAVGVGRALRFVRRESARRVPPDTPVNRAARAASESTTPDLTRDLCHRDCIPAKVARCWPPGFVTASVKPLSVDGCVTLPATGEPWHVRLPRRVITRRDRLSFGAVGEGRVSVERIEVYEVRVAVLSREGVGFCLVMSFDDDLLAPSVDSQPLTHQSHSSRLLGALQRSHFFSHGRVILPARTRPHAPQVGRTSVMWPHPAAFPSRSTTRSFGSAASGGLGRDAPITPCSSSVASAARSGSPGTAAAAGARTGTPARARSSRRPGCRGSRHSPGRRRR